MNFITDNLAFILIPFVFMTVSLIGGFLHKHQLVFMSLAFLLSIGLYMLGGELIHALVFSGHLSLAIFMLVMITGILPKQSLYRNVLEHVRGDLAVYGFIFLFPHVLSQITPINAYVITGFITLIFMVPLVFTSVRKVKVLMPQRRWKDMHKIAYVIYGLLYMHSVFYIEFSPQLMIESKPFAWPFHLFSILYILLKVIPFTANIMKR